MNNISIRDFETDRLLIKKPTMDEQFTYVLPGWEGSTADSRVLQDAINRRNGLKVPIGKNYPFIGIYVVRII